MSQATAGQIAVQGIFYSALLFVLAVSAFWPWWRSQLGWSITAQEVAFAAAFLTAMITYWTGGDVPHWMNWAAIAAAWAVPPLLAWRAVVIFKAQRKARDII